jgi:hypothetical protein
MRVAARRVAADYDGKAPRPERCPLASRPNSATLKRWLRRWTNVRHRWPALAAGGSPAVLADALLAAETEGVFADTGHSLDFIDEAFGWEHATAVLPTVVGHMVAARGAEEIDPWRRPIDLVVQWPTADWLAIGHGVHGRSDHAALAGEMLGGDPRRGRSG